MEQTLFTEVLPLYKSKKNNSYTIRIRIRMQDRIDYALLKLSVDTTMRRYPYFCVKLRTEGQGFVFEDNQRPVVVSASSHGMTLNGASSNYHMLTFSGYDNWIVVDVFHGLTDGTGTYEVIRTLLYYYCSNRYNVKLSSQGIRLVEEVVSAEEWECPVKKIVNLPPPPHYDLSPALNPAAEGKLHTDDLCTVYGIMTDEAAFMRFNRENGASPATMVSLLLSRAMAKLFPRASEAIRIILSVNQRKALHVSLAHQSLVGGALLEYGEALRHLPLHEQVKAYRKMVSEQTTENNVIVGVSNIVRLTQMMLSKSTDKARIEIATSVDKMASVIGSACVSYVGKANFAEAEKYIQEFHTWSYSTLPITIQMSAVNGKITFDFIQKFHSSVFVNAFLKELAEQGISCELQKGVPMKLPSIELPWNDEL